MTPSPAARLDGPRGRCASPAPFKLRSIAADRHAWRRQGDRLELVWSGPPAPGPDLSDTATVVRTLCRSAERSVLVGGGGFRSYDVTTNALYHGMGQLPEPVYQHRFC